MKTFDWGAFFRGVQKAIDDIKANKPRPAGPPLTGAELEADLEELKTAIPVMQAWLAAHPGVLTALDDLLAVLEAEGFAWASPLRAGVDAAPGAVSGAAEWLPRVIALLSVFHAAVRGGPPIAEGGWSRTTAPPDNNPDNPSGAVGGGKRPTPDE